MFKVESSAVTSVVTLNILTTILHLCVYFNLLYPLAATEASPYLPDSNFGFNYSTKSKRRQAGMFEPGVDIVGLLLQKGAPPSPAQATTLQNICECLITGGNAPNTSN